MDRKSGETWTKLTSKKIGKVADVTSETQLSALLIFKTDSTCLENGISSNCNGRLEHHNTPSVHFEDNSSILPSPNLRIWWNSCTGPCIGQWLPSSMGETSSCQQKWGSDIRKIQRVSPAALNTGYRSNIKNAVGLSGNGIPQKFQC